MKSLVLAFITLILLFLAIPASASPGDACSSDANCSNLERCGVRNRNFFADFEGSACWAASCQATEFQCQNCGSRNSPCGECPPHEVCDPDTRIVKLRVWNLVANDGSGLSSGTDEASTRKKIHPEIFIPNRTAANRLLASCGLGNTVQLSFESLQTAQVRPACINTNEQCHLDIRNFLQAADSGDYLNVVQKLSGGSWAFGADKLSVLGFTIADYFSQTTAHEFVHVLEFERNPPEYVGGHYPDAHSNCTNSPLQNNLMCTTRRGLQLNQAQCDYMYRPNHSEPFPWYIREGSTHGDFVISQINNIGASPGHYSFEVSSPTAGSVSLKRDGVVQTTAPYLWRATVTETVEAGVIIPGFFQLFFRSRLGSRNLFALNESIFDDGKVLRVEIPSEERIRPGSKHGRYVVQDIQLLGAASGDYTFTITSNGRFLRTVHLNLNGQRVASSAAYHWQTKVTADTPHIFIFPGHFSIHLTAARGSLNLHNIAQDIFDGNRILRL